MTELATANRYGVLTEPATLQIERVLPGPIERVWAWLTDGELRRRWLAAGEMPMQVGAAFELVARNDELTDPPGLRPPGFQAEHRLQSRIVALDPPRLLVIAWGGSGEVSFALAPQGDEVKLTLTHRRLPDRPRTLMIGAGWHTHLDILAARLRNEAPAPFWEAWSRLRDEYDQRIPT